MYMNGLDVLLIALGLIVFWQIMKSMDRHEAWLNRQPLREEARRRYQEALTCNIDDLYEEEA